MLLAIREALTAKIELPDWVENSNPMLEKYAWIRFEGLDNHGQPIRLTLTYPELTRIMHEVANLIASVKGEGSEL